MNGRRAARGAVLLLGLRLGHDGRQREAVVAGRSVGRGGVTGRCGSGGHVVGRHGGVAASGGGVVHGTLLVVLVFVARAQVAVKTCLLAFLSFHLKTNEHIY